MKQYKQQIKEEQKLDAALDYKRFNELLAAEYQEPEVHIEKQAQQEKPYDMQEIAKIGRKRAIVKARAGELELEVEKMAEWYKPTLGPEGFVPGKVEYKDITWLRYQGQVVFMFAHDPKGLDHFKDAWKPGKGVYKQQLEQLRDKVDKGRFKLELLWINKRLDERFE